MANNNFRLSLILIIFSIGLYANTLQNGYAIDDGQVITYNRLVQQGVGSIPEILSSSRLSGYGHIENDSYRPMSLVTFAVEHQFFGGTPFTGHLFNILFFACCVWVLFLFLNKLFNNSILSFIAAMIFAVHPIHTEVVANIKSRDELLCFLFAISAIIQFINYSTRGRILHLLLGALLLFAALLSKENAITLLLIVPLIFFFYLNENKRRSLFITVSTFAAALSFIALRHAILGDGSDIKVLFTANPLVNAPDFMTRLATAIYGLGMYIKLLVIPHPLICDYSWCSIPFVTFGNLYVILSLVVLVAIAATGIYRLIKFKKDPWAFGILFFLCSIALFSNIAFLVYSQFAERFLFFASAGFCLIVAMAAEKVLLSSGSGLSQLVRPKVLAVLVPLLAVFGYLTYARNADWKDNFTLYRTDVVKAPENGWLNYNLGNQLITTIFDNEPDIEAKKRAVDDAIAYLSQTVAVLPDYADAHAQLSAAFSRKSMTDSAKTHALIALQLNPANIPALISLGAAYFSGKEYANAIKSFEQALAIKPDFVIAYGNIGTCFINLNQFDSAVIYLQKALAADQNNKGLYRNFALAYYKAGQKDSAAKYEQIAQQYFPQFRLPTN